MKKNCLCFTIIILSFFIVHVGQSLSSSKNMGYDKIEKENNEVKYTNNEKEAEKLFGKWKFTKRIMYPKAYSKRSEEHTSELQSQR